MEGNTKTQRPGKDLHVWESQGVECGWDWREVSQPRGVGREQVLKGLCAVLKGP